MPKSREELTEKLRSVEEVVLRGDPKTAEQRQAVELRFIEGMSVAETAEAMGRSDEAVKKLQARALANLRRYLAPPTPAAAPTRMARPASSLLRMAVA